MRTTLTIAALAACAIATGASAVTEERLAFIKETNEKAGGLWKAGVNIRFADEPIGAAQRLCGVNITENRAAMDKMVADGKAVNYVPSAAMDIPESFDSETHWPHCAKTIGDIRDQSACGCCWAFGAAEAASDRMCISTNGQTILPLSAQNLCFCASWAGCDGGQLGQAWSYIQNNGLVTGGQNKGIGPFGAGYCSAFSLPHCHHHGPKGHGGDPYPSEGTPGCPSVSNSPSCPSQCDSGAKSPHNSFGSDKFTFKGNIMNVPDNADQIAQAIMEGGPVECAFTVYKDFENYVGGIYNQTSNQQLGGHAVKIVGWGVENGVKYWKIANSWNPYWGEKGYFRIVRGVDMCGIESNVVAADASSTWGPMSN